MRFRLLPEAGAQWRLSVGEALDACGPATEIDDRLLVAACNRCFDSWSCWDRRSRVSPAAAAAALVIGCQGESRRR